VRVLLTETELRVAELAADATEIEAIAAVLGVRPAEAAGLLETVYRKLGRAESA
jgi:predicted urease superfamily metal-dependent hydrolase